MKWTYTLPTKPGFYYWQGLNLYGDMVAVVQVNAFQDESRPLEACELRIDIQNAPDRGPVESWGGRWAGPLPQPYY